jgi:hypothetical protein
MRSLKTLLLSLLLTSLLAPPAIAGGWWSSIGLEGQPVGRGESIYLKVSEVMFDTLQQAEQAKRETYFAYLVRGFDQEALDDAMTRANPGDWWNPTSEPIRAGDVRLINWDSNLAKGRVQLNVPDVPPGSYYLMLCDLGCEVTLGNLVPSQVNVTNDVLAAQTTRRLQQTEADLTLALQRSRSELRETRLTIRQALSNNANQVDRIKTLETKLADATRTEPQPWIGYAGWFVAGVIGALLFLLRTSKRSQTNVLMERVPDDARELINSP